MTTSRLTDEQIVELERLERAATPEPWRQEDDEGLMVVGPNVAYPGEEMVIADAIATDADAGFLAAARNALPSLLSEVRASRAAATHHWNRRVEAESRAAVLAARVEALEGALRDAERVVAVTRPGKSETREAFGQRLEYGIRAALARADFTPAAKTSRSEALALALAAVAREKCPACPGGERQGHDDRCWVGEILRGTPGPAYDAACAALAAPAASPTPTEDRHDD